jgi:hypothetical protein
MFQGLDEVGCEANHLYKSSVKVKELEEIYLLSSISFHGEFRVKEIKSRLKSGMLAIMFGLPVCHTKI